MVDRSNGTRDFALLIGLSTLWGASYTFIRVGVETIPPVTLIAARTLVAGGVLFAVLRMRGLALPRDRGAWTRFLVQACFNSVVPFTLIAWAEKSTDAGLATILNSTSPVFAFLLTASITRHEAITRRKLFGVAAGLIGTCLIVGISALRGVGHEAWAQFAIVAATICYACAAIFGRTFKDLDPMLPATGSLLCGAAILVPMSALVDRPWTLVPSARSVLALLALALFSTALAFVVYFRLVQTLGPLKTTMQAYLRVPIGVMFGVVFLGETLAPTAWLGLICIVAGVVAMTLPDRSRHRVTSPRPDATTEASASQGVEITRSGSSGQASESVPASTPATAACRARRSR